MAYSDKVIDHYENPRNVGVLDKNAENVGTGMVGAPACGDVMRLQIQVNDEGVIEEAKKQGHKTLALSTEPENHKGIKLYESLGFKKDKVYRLIARYKLVLANCENRALVENLPLSLSYELAKNSCSQELREKVLNGEIKTLCDISRESGINRETILKRYKSGYNGNDLIFNGIIDNTSGTVGVSYSNSQNNWRAYINVDGKRIELGRRKNKEDAIKLRKDAEVKYFGEYLRNEGDILNGTR